LVDAVTEVSASVLADDTDVLGNEDALADAASSKPKNLVNLTKALLGLELEALFDGFSVSIYRFKKKK
jgi:hypothetical protein